MKLNVYKPNKTILCSDAHVSYKGFAIDNNIEHHALKAIIKQRVKNKVYHIQHVNSTHNKLKKMDRQYILGRINKIFATVFKLVSS